MRTKKKTFFKLESFLQGSSSILYFKSFVCFILICGNLSINRVIQLITWWTHKFLICCAPNNFTWILCHFCICYTYKSTSDHLVQFETKRKKKITRTYVTIKIIKPTIWYKLLILYRLVNMETKLCNIRFNSID